MSVDKWESPCGRVVLYCGDCLEVLPTIGKVDCVVTDPPYGIDAAEMTMGVGQRNFTRGDWDKVRPDITPVVASASVLVVWGGNYFADVLPPSNDWLVWHKKNDGRSFSECEMAWTNLGCNTRHKSHHWAGENKRHPTQKPLEVMRWTLEWVPETLIVTDPYFGSGTTGVAAVQLGRRFIGIENEPVYFEIAKRRIMEALGMEVSVNGVKQRRMFTEPTT